MGPAAALDPTATGEDIEARIADFHRTHQQLLVDILTEVGIDDPIDWAAKAFSQSKLFAAEILPLIHRLYEPEPVNVEKTFLDIGAQNFAGTHLIQSIHQPNSFNKLKLRVSALDIHDRFRNLQKLVAPDCEFIVSDLFNVADRAWDMVLASHVIEHVPEPHKFVQRMQELAIDYVIVAAPWNENPIVTASHVNTIDKKFVRLVRGRDLNIFTNYSWGKEREVCTFWLPGRAALSS